MQKKFILFFFLFCLFLFGTGTLIWLKQTQFLSKAVASEIEKQLAKVLLQSVQIKESQLHFFPPSVKIRQITSHGNTSLSIENVTVSFNLWSLLTSSFFISKIVVDRPILTLTPKSAIHFPEEKKQKAVIRRIQIQQGKLAYLAKNREFHLDPFDMTIEPSFQMDRFPIRFLAKEGHMLFENQEKRFSPLEGVIVINKAKPNSPLSIEITKINAEAGQTKLSVTGSVLLSEKGASEPLLNLKFAGKIPIEDALPTQSVLSPLSGNLQFEGLLSGAFTNPVMKGNLSIAHFFSKEEEIGSLQSEFLYQNKKAVFKKISANLFSGKGVGEAMIQLPEQASFSEKGAYTVSLQYDHYALDKVAHFLSAEKADQSAIFSGLLGKGTITLTGFGTNPNDIEGAGILEMRRTARPPAELTAPRRGRTTAGRGEKTETSHMDEWRQITKAITTASPSRLLSLVNEGKWVWSKSRDGFQIHQGMLSFPQGKASLSGRFEKSTGFAFNAWISGDEIKTLADPLQIPLTGRFYIAGALSGTPKQPSFDGQIKLDHWTLKRLPFGAFQTNLLYQDKILTFRDGTLEGARPIKFTGNDPLYRFNGTFHLPNQNTPSVYQFTTDARSINPQEMIALFANNIPFSTLASGEVSIKGVDNAVVISGPLTLGEGSLYGEPFTNGRLLMNVTEKSVRLRNIFLEKNEMTAEGDAEIAYTGDYTLDAKGSELLLQEINLITKQIPHIEGKATLLTVNGKGTLSTPKLKFFATIENAKYKEVALDLGTLKADWQDKSVVFSISFPQKKFSLSGTVGTPKPYPVSFETRFSDFPIHALFLKRQAPLSEISFYSDGTFSGQGTLESLWESDIKGTLSLLSAQWGEYLLVNDGAVTFMAKKGDYQIENAVFKGANTDLSVSGRLTPFKNLGLIIKGAADLNLLRLFTPKVYSANGVAKMDIRISDQWENPTMAGILSLDTGLIALANFSDPIAITALSLVLNKQSLTLENVSGKMGQGQFAGFGRADLSGFSLTRFGFQFDLQKMPVRLIPDVKSVIEGKLIFQGNREAQSLEGSLHIDKALYEKRVNMLDLLNQWRKNQEERIPINLPFAQTTNLSIRLEGKDNIAVQNNIAKVPLEVDLFLKGTLERPLLFGQVNIPKGTFSFRANEFKVTSGNVQFVNPEKIDPLFDIKGQSKVRDYTVELSLMGTISKFFMDIISFPPLLSADILSLLAFGKTTTELAESDAGGNTVTTSVVSEVIAGLLAAPVQEFTGLDRISIGVPSGKSSKNTIFTAEKRVLNDKLLVIYSNSFDPTEEANIQMFHDLGRNISIGVERNEKGQLGGDLRFRFELQ